VIINDEVEKKYFKGQNPVGQRLTFDKVPNDKSEWLTIVGVVLGERQQALAAEPSIEAFVPYAQEATEAMSVLARVSGDPAAIGPAIRRLVAELDPELPITKMQSVDEIRARSLARERFLMTMLVVFATVGLLLAVIGVYGVLGQVARRRTREMGIRIALGSPVSSVRWIVVRHGLTHVVSGLAIGIAVAVLATRGLSALLYHVAPADPMTFVAVPIVLALTGVVAAWIPAVQASRADPAIALRGE
jgi:predicted lysophospholipase L1 biosynthesis ABC-type transport system permease subunit